MAFYPVHIWSPVKCLWNRLTRSDSELKKATVSVCLGLRDFWGQGTFSTKTEKNLRQIGMGSHLLSSMRKVVHQTWVSSKYRCYLPLEWVLGRKLRSFCSQEPQFSSNSLRIAPASGFTMVWTQGGKKGFYVFMDLTKWKREEQKGRDVNGQHLADEQ